MNKDTDMTLLPLALDSVFVKVYDLIFNIQLLNACNQRQN